MVFVGNKPGPNGQIKSEGLANAGLGLAIGGLAVAFVGIALLSQARAKQQDAINMYNDDAFGKTRAAPAPAP